MDTLFRIATSEVEFEVEGSEEFVLRQMQRFLPGLPAASGAGTEAIDDSDLAAWYHRHVPRGRSPSMQDSVLIFGYYLKRETERHMFSPGDMKRAFSEVGRAVPKSLLQIMGTLKRDLELLWSPGDKRGVYALSPTGIRHVERVLSISRSAEEAPPAPRDPAPGSRPAAPPGEGGKDPSATGPERWSRLFKPGNRRHS